MNIQSSILKGLSTVQRTSDPSPEHRSRPGELACDPKSLSTVQRKSATNPEHRSRPGELACAPRSQFCPPVLRFSKLDLVTKSGLALLLVLLVAVLIIPLSPLNQAHANTIKSHTVLTRDTLSSRVSRSRVRVAKRASAIRHHRSKHGRTSGNAAFWYAGDSYTKMIHRVFGPYGNQAVRVARCESNLRPHAFNGILGAVGLFQIIPPTWVSTSYANQSVFNPLANTKAAYEIFARDGYSWREWACRP